MPGHIAVDTQGLPLDVVVHAAEIQDAEGLHELLKRIKPPYLEGVQLKGELTRQDSSCLRRKLIEGKGFLESEVRGMPRSSKTPSGYTFLEPVDDRIAEPANRLVGCRRSRSVVASTGVVEIRCP
jgi:DDE family transposase